MHHKKIIDNNRLIVISHSYNNFQKSCIEGVSPFFQDIHVLVRTNPFAEVSNIIPSSYLERYNQSYKIDLSGKPSNINVRITPIWYLPTGNSYKSLGNKHFKVVENAIEKYNFQFDLVHAQFIWSAGYVGARLKEKYNIPFIITARGYDIYSLPFKDSEWQERIEYVLNTADYITTVSQSNLDCIHKLDVTTPAEIIPNGFQTEMFSPKNMILCRKALHLPLDKKIILTVGNLEPVKGQQYLIDAMSIIAGERKDVLCVIIGAGKMKNVLNKQIKLLGLEGVVILAGGKPHNTIPDWMNACDLFVLPSLNEGNPNVMFEALGCGKPFVGSRVGGIPDIINLDKYGLLVEPGDSNALSQKILIAIDKKWDGGNIVKYAGNFSREKMSKKMAGIYNMFMEI